MSGTPKSTVDSCTKISKHFIDRIKREGAENHYMERGYNSPLTDEEKIKLLHEKKQNGTNNDRDTEMNFLSDEHLQQMLCHIDEGKIMENENGIDSDTNMDFTTTTLIPNRCEDSNSESEKSQHDETVKSAKHVVKSKVDEFNNKLEVFSTHVNQLLINEEKRYETIEDIDGEFSNLNKLWEQTSDNYKHLNFQVNELNDRIEKLMKEIISDQDHQKKNEEMIKEIYEKLQKAEEEIEEKSQDSDDDIAELKEKLKISYHCATKPEDSEEIEKKSEDSDPDLDEDDIAEKQKFMISYHCDEIEKKSQDSDSDPDIEKGQ
ncbi:uncharacterized protein LOC142324563 [Lycorma delicatula]|uniref:uncharacterized protein LOC142324563 n=1 Tax=Lycorma delicatula TaxID=130591 RepID=UPI003F517F2E